jgi:hypothetical protein
MSTTRDGAVASSLSAIDRTRDCPDAAERAAAAELARRAPTSPFVARRFGISTDRFSFRSGKGSAEAVARSLQTLPEGWQVLHGVPTGCEHRVVDHVVIGPSGVFTLNIADHRGSDVHIEAPWIEADGARHASLHASGTEAERAARTLTRACGFAVPVQPVIVVIADTIIMTGDVGEVSVLSPKQVVSWLTDQPDTLDPTAVCAIYGQARRASVWR